MLQECSKNLDIRQVYVYRGSDRAILILISVLQECDQVHIDDVSSDDNGQDLR